MSDRMSDSSMHLLEQLVSDFAAASEAQQPQSAPDPRPEAAQVCDPQPAEGAGQSAPEQNVSAALATEANPNPAAGALTSQQQAALDELCQGTSIPEAARIAGVSRATLYRWLATNPQVRAAHNRWKATCDESTRSRLKALQDLAVDVIVEQLDTKRNGKLAAMLLDKMGFLAPNPPGAPDSRRAQLEIDLERRQRNLDLGQRSRNIALDQSMLSSEHRVEENKT